MTAFEFMGNALCISVGAICLSMAALVVFAAVIGAHKTIKGKGREK